MTNTDCTESPVARSRCIIEAILADLSETYTETGGGGIAAIRQETTSSYTIEILQEERIDLVTYTVDVAPDGTVKILDRKSGTDSP